MEKQSKGGRNRYLKVGHHLVKTRRYYTLGGVKRTTLSHSDSLRRDLPSPQANPSRTQAF